MRHFRLQLAELLLLVTLAGILVHYGQFVLRGELDFRGSAIPWLDLIWYGMWLGFWGILSLHCALQADDPEARRLAWHAPLLVGLASVYFVGMGLLIVSARRSGSWSVSPLEYYQGLIILSCLVSGVCFQQLLLPTIRGRLVLWGVALLLLLLAGCMTLAELGRAIASI